MSEPMTFEQAAALRKQVMAHPTYGAPESTYLSALAECYRREVETEDGFLRVLASMCHREFMECVEPIQKRRAALLSLSTKSPLLVLGEDGIQLLAQPNELPEELKPAEAGYLAIIEGEKARYPILFGFP